MIHPPTGHTIEVKASPAKQKSYGQIRHLAPLVDLQRVNTLSAQEVASEARTLSKKWPTLEAEERRQIVEAITEKIVIGKGEINRISY